MTRRATPRSASGHRRTAPAAAAFTLVEAAIFCALGALIIIAIIGLLHRSGHLLEVSRQASSAQGDLRVVIESLAADVDELDYLVDSSSYDSQSAAGGSGFKFVIHSARAESGFASNASQRRQIEYKVGAAETGTTNRELTRTVTLLDPSTGAAGQVSGPRTIAHAFQRLRIVPIAAGPVAGTPKFNLLAAGDAAAQAPRATVACFIVYASLGEAPAESKANVDQAPITSLAVKLWCRNRMLELSHGGPP